MIDLCVESCIVEDDVVNIFPILIVRNRVTCREMCR